jgi:hypothetical protein
MNEGRTTTSRFTSIINDEGPNHWKAEECMRLLGQLTPDDRLRSEVLQTAQTYALLAVADAGDIAEAIDKLRTETRHDVAEAIDNLAREIGSVGSENFPLHLRSD